MSSKFFLLLFIKMNQDITVIAGFYTKLFEFGRFELEIFIKVWFRLYGATLMVNGNLLQNVKRET